MGSKAVRTRKSNLASRAETPAIVRSPASARPPQTQERGELIVPHIVPREVQPPSRQPSTQKSLKSIQQSREQSPSRRSEASAQSRKPPLPSRQSREQSPSRKADMSPHSHKLSRRPSTDMEIPSEMHSENRNSAYKPISEVPSDSKEHSYNAVKHEQSAKKPTRAATSALVTKKVAVERPQWDMTTHIVYLEDADKQVLSTFKHGRHNMRSSSPKPSAYAENK